VTAKSFLLATALLIAVPSVAQQQTRRCHWWQFGHCDSTTDREIEGLPDGAPRVGTIVTIDVSTNTAYLFKDGKLIRKSPAATGSGKSLINGDDEWLFRTPQGRMKVLRKIVDPVWRKPDWAFIEAGEKVPPPDSPARLVKGHLGKYALDLGEGIMIHGTDDPHSIGRYISHGCVRLPNNMLATVFRSVKVGTEVYIFESLPPQASSSK